MRKLCAKLFLSAMIESVLSIPYLIPSPPKQPPIPFDPLHLEQPPRPHSPQPPRQADPLSSLLIPECALSCYLQALPDDGCALEIDLKCHCSTGNILGKAEACVEAACSSADQEDAERKIAQACRAIGINPSVPVGLPSTAASPSSRATSTKVATTTSPVYSIPSTSKGQSTVAPPPPSKDQPSNSPSSSLATQTTATSVSIKSMSLRPLQTSTPTPTPTNTSLAVPVSDHTLSDGAKAGISISVLFVASTIFIALSLYIRRLKRQLALAKAAANVPDSVLRSPSHRHSSIQEALFTPSRRRSWPNTSRNRRFSRRDGIMSESPVSPLSPVFFRDGGRRASIAGVLNKKRGNVLSVVVEREDEDANSLMSRGRSVREPVPGQSEGLVGPLEMDGQFAAIFEAPTSITPRARSTERDRDEWKEYDFGKF